MTIGLSVSTTGMLSILGDDLPDDVTVYKSGSSTIVRSTSPNGAVSVWNMGSTVNSMEIRTKGGNDSVSNNTAFPASIWGGSGDDVLNGGTARDYLYGEVGNDTLRGNAGSDVIYGGSDNDSMYGNAGADYIYGEGGNDVLTGGGGSDWLSGDAGVDSLYGDDGFGAAIVDGEAAGADNLSGGEGNDTLSGGANSDTLFGNAGNDYLYGQDGNDRLFGDAGLDTLYGMNGDDFLDTGSSGETYNGGDGNDFNANRTVINGATTDDIAQSSSENCFILAAMGAAASRGVDLASRITNLGRGSFNVSLFKRNSSGTYTPTNVIVLFMGALNPTDPQAHFRGQEGESWTVIMNRAIAQVLGVDLASSYGGDAGDALGVIVGRPKNTTNWIDNSGYVSPFYRDPLLDYLYAVGNATPTIAASRGTQSELSSNMFVANHAYVVKAVYISGYIYSPVTYQNIPQYTFVLSNPWGIDREAWKIANGTASSSGDNNDGVLVISGAQFKRNFRAITFA